MAAVRVKKGRDASLQRRHPWLFSGAVQSIEGNPAEGEVVRVELCDGTLVGYGHYQIGSISVRILSWGDEYEPDGAFAFPHAFWVERLRCALDCRKAQGLTGNSDCYRLVHGEGDNLPGLIIDIYCDCAVMQAHSAGMFHSREQIAAALREVYGPSLKAFYDKSQGTAPFKAGLPLQDGYIWQGAELSLPVVAKENGHLFYVDWVSGQKTGFFLDQRDNRRLVGECASGRRVLNLFCYTGGFSIYALAKGAQSVVSVDSSQTAIDMLENNVRLNFPEGGIAHESVCGDAIDYLRDAPKGRFDLIVVDPPAFAKHRGALDNALRAYRRLNSHAIEKVAPGGLVFTYSCSQVVDRHSFELTIFSAAASTGRRVRILRRLCQGGDHPVNIYHPEGEYLKGLLLQVE